MALQELINSLRKNEQKQLENIWQAAKKEAENLRLQIDEAIAAETAHYDARLASASRNSRRSILSGAADSTRKKKLYAYQVLEHNLQHAAASQLPLLRQKNYEAVFALLVAELPKRDWEKIVVNPADTALAAKFFAGGIINPDPSVSGGLIAATESDRIIVDNTFEKRLERKWPQLLPALFAEINAHYEKSGSPENTAEK